MEQVQPQSNFQIYPSKKLIVPNDRLSKKLFSLTLADLQGWIAQQNTVNLVEVLQHRKFGKILSPLKLSVDDEHFTISEPIDQFDRAVLSACISEWYAGNRHTTPAIIYRAITGKIGRGDAEPGKKQLADILDSLKVLMRIQLDYDLTGYCERLGGNNNRPARMVSALLPAYYLRDSTINGHDATVIHFDRESPLLTSAQIKNNQLLSFDSSLLEVPHQQNTRMNISVKFYVLSRILEIKFHKMAPTITFADVFDKCCLTNAARKTKMNAREVILKLLEHLLEEKVVRSFKFVKKGIGFYAVTFTYDS